MNSIGLSFVLCLLLAPATPDSLQAIKTEPSLERRAERAIEYMDAAFKIAQSSFKQGSPMETVQTSLNEMAESGELALQSLRDTGKRPSKLSKQYKRGEVKTRELLRKVESFTQSLNFDDRPAAEKTKLRLQVVQEEFLLGVMSKN